jgi:hypothetical protein
LRGRDGGADAQANANGQEAGAYDFGGKSYNGGIGGRGEACAGAEFPSGAGDAEGDELIEAACLVGDGFAFSCDVMGCASSLRAGLMHGRARPYFNAFAAEPLSMPDRQITKGNT